MGLSLYVGAGAGPVRLPLATANRHGLIAGATGTGKTVSLRVLAEQFAEAGVPVFVADVKGDLSGLAAAGEPSPRIEERARSLGMDLRLHASPVLFWDVFGRTGHPLRTTISDIGPTLLARMLGLNETQEGVLSIAFRVADEQGLLLLDLKDLRALLQHVSQNAKALTAQFGNVGLASVGAIQRALTMLESQGAESFLGEPALALADLMRTDRSGRGMISVLSAENLIRTPKLYATILLWLLAELFEELPEAGDLDQPKLVFFFDEAHLLFEDADSALTDQVEQVVRLIRSKGVGIYFVSQSPLDIPDKVLGQLGHRIQHALRAFTPRDQKSVRAVAETFRPNPAIDTAAAVQELGIGEALVSVLDEKGVPSRVDRVMVAPPASRLGPLTEQERSANLQASPLAGAYDARADRESAYERLARKTEAAPLPPGPRSSPRGQEQIVETLITDLARGVARAAGSRLGREIVRGLFGALRRR
jgi:DNA helicase HerA-like ATPase